MKTVAIFSDIHGNRPALEAIIADAKARHADELICLGDVVGIGPSPRECLETIIANNVRLILGNHELYSLKGVYIDGEYEEIKNQHEIWMRDQLTDSQLAFLKTCPMQIKESIANHSFAFQHFIFNPDPTDSYPFADFSTVLDGSIKTLAKKVDAEYIFIGHHHDAFEITSDHQKIIDVGSSGCIKGSQTFYTLLTVNGDDITIEKIYLDYDRQALIEAFEGVNYPAREYAGISFFGIS